MTNAARRATAIVLAASLLASQAHAPSVAHAAGGVPRTGQGEVAERLDAAPPPNEAADGTTRGAAAGTMGLAPLGSPADDAVAGEACAVLCDDGSLVLARATGEVTDGPGQEVADAFGTTLSGEVYAGIEDIAPSCAEEVPWHARRDEVTSFRVSPGAAVRPASLAWWFCGCGALSSFDAAGLDASAATSLAHMFDGCVSLTGLDLSPVSTPSAEDLSGMFRGCSSLRLLDASSLDMGAARLADGMFEGCTSLREVRLGTAFSFLPGDTCDNELPDAPCDELHTGCWASTTNETLAHDGFSLSMAYDGATMAGAWAWETRHDCPLSLDLDGGDAPDGAAYPTSYAAGTGVELPGTEGSGQPAPVREGYDFAGWADEEGRHVGMVDALSRGARTMRAMWRSAQIRMRVPAEVTLRATRAQDGSLALGWDGGDYSLCVENLSDVNVDVSARAEPAAGFAIADPGGTPGDREADVWVTPTVTGPVPAGDGYDPASDASHHEHGSVRLSELGDGRVVAGPVSPGGRLWLNGLGGTMGDWCDDDGSRAHLATISWTFSLASGE